MAYKSRFRPTNREKYLGNLNHVICRSTWERQLAKWADKNGSVIKWGMEYVVVPYLDKASGKRRRYFTDFYFEFSDGQILLIEVKPDHQTRAPKKRSRNGMPTKKYLKETLTYATNTSKWDAARLFAESKGWKFAIWTEYHLKKLGLTLITEKKSKRYYAKNKSKKARK